MNYIKKNWYWIGFIIFLVGIFVAFLWNERGDLDINKKINDSKAYNLFASIGSITTLLLLFVAYQQLKTTQKQIFDANLPHLLLNDLEFKISFEKFEGEFDYKIQLWDDYHEINLTNVGLGTAKNITVTWEYDYTLASKRKIDFLMNTTYNKSVSYMSKDGTHLITPPFEYLASIIHSEDNFRASIYNDKFLGNHKFQKTLDGDKLRLIISYKDIYSRDIKQYFNVKIDAITEGTKDGKYNSYFISLKFSEEVNSSKQI